MVQRKAPPKLERSSQPSSDNQQDLKKRRKMKLERSMLAADLDSLQASDPMKKAMKRSLPNYMKPTSCSDARKEKTKLQVNNSTHHKNLKNLKMTKRPLKGVAVSRATCSSTLKDSKFHEGKSVMRVCPYSYCSLHGHRHHEDLPTLKCFVSARRKLVKTQKRLKLNGLKEKKEMDNEQVCDKNGDKSFVYAFDFDWREERISPFHGEDGDDDSKSNEGEEFCRVADDNGDVCDLCESEQDISEADAGEEQQDLLIDTDLLSIAQFFDTEEMCQAEGSITESESRTRIIRKKIVVPDDESNENYVREFNPRAPRFLDVENDLESEKVDLRHQDVDERKNSEEYLIDCALQRALTKLAPARKRKVALLVEAFETVMPPPPTNARMMQACS